jgi:hypothetical protein
MLTPFRWDLAVLGVSMLAQPVRSQSLAPLRVTVADSGARPVAQSDVRVLRGLTQELARGNTDSTGRITLAVPVDGDFEVVARRIGYLRSSQFVSGQRAGLSVALVLAAVPVVLDAVQTTAAVDPRYRAYHLDAEEIAASDRELHDALDVLTKLRPDMIRPRQAYISEVRCDPQYIWINGAEIRDAPRTNRLEWDLWQRRTIPAATPKVLAKHLSGVEWLPPDLVNTLQTIRPEHIAEINYSDCYKPLTGSPHGLNAVFVVLKPGVLFTPGVGSYVPR